MAGPCADYGQWTKFWRPSIPRSDRKRKDIVSKNETVKDAVALSQEAIDAIELLSTDQQDALKLATEVVRHAARLTKLESQIGDYTFAERTEDQYEEEKDNGLLDDNTIYFVHENDVSEEQPDDYE